EDVERHPFTGGVGSVGERELRVRVAEPPDEPGGGDAVDVGARARHPRAPARRKGCAMAPASWHGRARLAGAQTLGGRLPDGARALPGRRLEVIDRLDPIELTLQGVELAAELRDGRAVLALIAIERPEDFSAALHGRVVLGAARLVEQRGDVVVG